MRRCFRSGHGSAIGLTKISSAGVSTPTSREPHTIGSLVAATLASCIGAFVLPVRWIGLPHGPTTLPPSSASFLTLASESLREKRVGDGHKSGALGHLRPGL